MKRTYIAGPMTGIADFNRAAFNYAAEKLKGMGYQVENPAKNNEYLPTPPNWRAYMTLALNQLLKCERVVLLPGWENSRGAKIEAQLARDLGMEVLTWQEVVS
jgi:hypothetical protein